MRSYEDIDRQLAREAYAKALLDAQVDDEFDEVTELSTILTGDSLDGVRLEGGAAELPGWPPFWSNRPRPSKRVAAMVGSFPIPQQAPKSFVAVVQDSVMGTLGFGLIFSGAALLVYAAVM